MVLPFSARGGGDEEMGRSSHWSGAAVWRWRAEGREVDGWDCDEVDGRVFEELGRGSKLRKVEDDLIRVPPEFSEVVDFLARRRG